MTGQAVATFSSADLVEDGIIIPNIVRTWSDGSKYFVPVRNQRKLKKDLHQRANLKTLKNSPVVGTTAFAASNGIFLLTGYSAVSLAAAGIAAVLSVGVFHLHSYPFKKRKNLKKSLDQANLIAFNEWMDKRYGFHVDEKSTNNMKHVMRAVNCGKIYGEGYIDFTGSNGKIYFLRLNRQGNLRVLVDSSRYSKEITVVPSGKVNQVSLPEKALRTSKEFDVLLSSLNNDVDLLKTYSLTSDQEYVLTRAVSESKACGKLLDHALALDSDADTTPMVEALRVVCSEISTVKSDVLKALMIEASTLNSYRVPGKDSPQLGKTVGKRHVGRLIRS